MATDSDDGAFTIRELTGDRRTVALIGKYSLPAGPYKVEGRQRVETTWYAGSPTGTQQAGGASEMPSSIGGIWRTYQLLGRGQVEVDGENVGVVDTAAGLTELFDDIRKKGQDLEVTWNHLVRVGTMVRFAQSWATADDVSWEAEFDYRSQGEDTEARAASTRRASASLPESAQEVAGRADDLDNATQDMGFYLDGSVDQGLLESIDQGIGDIQDRVFDVQDAVGALSDAIGAPINTALRAASILSLLENTALVVATEFRGRVDRTIFAVGKVQDLAAITPGKCVAATVVAFGSIRSARELRAAAARRRVAVQRERESTILALYRAGGDDDLRNVAVQFYGRPDDWGVIRSYNGLSTSKLLPGQVVIVPLPGVV